MEPLGWMGALGPLGWPLAAAALLGLAAGVSRALAAPFAPRLAVRLGTAARWAWAAAGLTLLALIAFGATMGTEAGILGGVSRRLAPVWLAMAAVGLASFALRRRLGVYGQLYGNAAGLAGLALVSFWAFAALFAGLGLVVTLPPLEQVSGLKNALPGSPTPDGAAYPYYLLGGDNLARDVFSRMIAGAVPVLAIAPAATLLAALVGIALGLPAGYHGGRLDAGLTFLANLVLAFPVILLFYLLVTPEIIRSGLPGWLAAGLLAVPLGLAGALIAARLRARRGLRAGLLALLAVAGGWALLSLASGDGGAAFLPARLDLLDVPPNLLVVFVAVTFVNAPTVFRLVRGLTLDLRTRDYVAAARTRGEPSWYVMLWEILPNARGPLIVDSCLRIGYTTILLGTLGFFGLGLSPESPDWGSTINDGRRLLSLYLHPALAPALALLSLVLGLNLLADALREESLRD